MARSSELRRGALAVALRMAFTAGSWTETRVLPVVANAQVGEVGRNGTGVAFDTRFKTVRPCAGIGLARRPGPVCRLSELDTREGLHRTPAARPMGPRQAGS